MIRGVSEAAVETTPTDVPLDHEQFGEAFLRLVLHLDRVLESVDRILGDSFTLGPIGAGPGRKVATLTASGVFGKTYGELLPGPGVTYRVMLPVTVDFDLDLHVDSHHFHAEVLVPLTVVLRTVAPLTIVWDIVPPEESELTIEIAGETRRSAWLQRFAGIDGELSRFLLRFVDRELDKPHVRRARRIEVAEVIDGAWPQIAAQFLPNGPEDRT